MSLPGFLFLFAAAIIYKLVEIEFVEGEIYRVKAEEGTVKTFEIAANRGSVYTADGSLLATSVSRFDIRMDAVTISDADFEKRDQGIEQFHVGNVWQESGVLREKDTKSKGQQKPLSLYRAKPELFGISADQVLSHLQSRNLSGAVSSWSSAPSVSIRSGKWRSGLWAMTTTGAA